MEAHRIDGVLIAILEGQLGKPVSPDDKFEDLGMDSLDFMEFIAEVKAKFGRITDKELFAVHSIRDLAGLLQG